MQKSCFFQLVKVDAQTGVFEGVMASSALDAEKERMDYWKSKPVFQQWSQTQAHNTGGRSFGNLRAQHNPQDIAGVLTKPLEFDDANQQIKCTGKALGEHKDRLLSGAYGGMSIGGGYASRKPLSDGTTLYVPGPLVEVSLVDRPSNPECTFAVIKADGSRELRKFAPSKFSKLDRQNRRDLLRILGGEIAANLCKASDGRAVSNSQYGPSVRGNRQAEQLAYTSARDRQQRADPETEPYEPAPARASSTPTSFDWPHAPSGAGHQSKTQFPNRNTLVVKERTL